jgi:hypothetical protein
MIHPSRQPPGISPQDQPIQIDRKPGEDYQLTGVQKIFFGFFSLFISAQEDQQVSSANLLLQTNKGYN